MWLVLIILLNLHLSVRIIKTFLEILDFFRMEKSAKRMAEIWEESVKDNYENCQCCQENAEETQPAHNGKHAL